ncbi:nucleotide exchange factor Sil1p [[Candida] jaroonii]|uniref:Nucleotide exchange factor Sil1p n=1 Tax=[Candida] jaroonii TaxID=467808 RepID=A0ACA9Y3H0_9ASCO|nr:nucleotide exchange factor Sil1p [[Candida] jaroonii]
MKIALLYLLGSILASELICNPSYPTDCYPKVFIPTREWQEIKEGQDIPGGLHVRLNIDTLKREAKLLEEEESSEVSSNDLVIVDNQPETVDKTMEESIKSAIGEYKAKHRSKINTNSNDFKDFQSSVEDIKKYNVDELDGSLDSLMDLSHDIEYGIKITDDKSLLNALFELTSEVDVDTKEKIYRMIGASIRNNPTALDNFLENGKTQISIFIKELQNDPEIIKNRILGIFNVLVDNASFKYTYLSQLLDQLINVYPTLSSSSQTRLVNIFKDLKLVDNEANDNDNEISTYLQNKFIKNDFTDETQFQLYYDKLLELHKQADLKPQKEFVAWLDEEVGLRQQGLKKHDNLYSGNQEFDDKLLETRHKVFGNPNALRKHFVDDEL